MSRTLEHVLDEWLVLKAQGGDSGALEELAERYHRRFLGLAYRFTGTAESAAEVTQEAWVAIMKRLWSLDDPARFRAWASRIVVRRAVDWVRSQRRGRQLNDRLAADPSLSRPEALEDKAIELEDGPSESIAQLRAALRQLTPDRRALLSLYYNDGLSIREIAEALEIPEGTVKTRLFHSRQLLKKHLLLEVQ